MTSRTDYQATEHLSLKTNAIKPLYEIIKKLNASKPNYVQNELGIEFTDFKIQKNALQDHKPLVLLEAVALLRSVVLQDPSKDMIRYAENGLPSSHNGIQMPREVRASFDEKGTLHVTILGKYASFPTKEVNEKLEKGINRLIEQELKKTLSNTIYESIGSVERLGMLAESLAPEQSTKLDECRDRLFEACLKARGRKQDISFSQEASTYFDTLMGFLDRIPGADKRSLTIEDIKGGLASAYSELVGSAPKPASTSKVR